jgi:magnesium-transporting ATPase (P-type)
MKIHKKTRASPATGTPASASASNYHGASSHDVLQALDANPKQGLTSEQVTDRQQQYGANRLTPRRGKHPLVLFLSQFHHPLIYILLISAGVTIALEGWVDASVIVGVVLINAIIGFIQEINALRAIEALSRALNINAWVVRDGQRGLIDASELVPGDIVLLQSGDKVPADLRLLQVRELQIDESTLTGESVPVEKRIQTLPENTPLVERSNMTYSSTLVTYGTGVGVVVGIGDQTEIGRINRMIAEATDLETPLTRKIGQFSWVLMWFIILLAALAFAAGWWRGEDLVDTFVASVALAVAAIPEGLPAAVTIILAIGVKRMARRNAIIRKLPAVETLGGTTIICSDKTGTLTQNQMTVRTVLAGGDLFELGGSGYKPEGDIRREGQVVTPAEHPALQELLKAGLLCNDARLTHEGDQWHIEGDPTEAALLVSAHKAGQRREPADAHHPRLDSIPFESAHQFMATLHHNKAVDAHHIYLKGSVESILKRCSTQFDANLNPEPLDIAEIQKTVATLASQGLRVLAFARGEHQDDERRLDHQHVQYGLTFLGLQAMIDPPRPEAIRAVADCLGAGIRVKMITGDHVGTAVAIAEQIGLGHRGSSSIAALEGRDLETVADDALPKLAEDTTVFARVAPEQKLRLVTALQQRGHVVAMTGDGVNDAPALRQANIGIAMGITGTEVSKEAAAMVLTDDNFATIAAAVEEGRGVYDNLVKFITFTIPTNIGQGLVVLIAILLGITLPILPVQILWLNMSTAILLGLPLAFEAKEKNLMQRQPKHPDQPILTRLLVFRSVVVGIILTAAAFWLFEWELAEGEPIPKARTAALNVFVIGQAFYLLNCRSLTYSMFKIGVFSNSTIWAGITLMLLAQAAITYLPSMNRLFHTMPLGLSEWGLSALCGLVIYLSVGFEKMLRRLLKKPRKSRATP